MTIDQAFNDVYTKFKMHFYREIFSTFNNREATLTTVETFCMEVIHAMNRPTIKEFADFIQISPPNAAYKVNNLVQKGYIKKIHSKVDKREYHLEVTQKYIDYYNVSAAYIDEVMKRVENHMPVEEKKHFLKALRFVSEECMRDVPNFNGIN